MMKSTRRSLSRDHLLARLVLPMVAAVALAGCGGAASVSSKTVIMGASTTTAPRPPPRCSSSELRVLLFGASAATGTGLTGIGIANTSSRPCWLQGVPKVRFYTTTTSGKRTRLAVHLSYAGPKMLFPLHPVRVILRHEQPVHSSLQRYPSVSAGFVITSRDFANGTNPHACEVVTSLSVRLPGPSSTLHNLSMQSRICDRPPPVAISAIVGRRVLFETVGHGI